MADKPKPMKASKPPGPDETVPGGAYIRGGFLAEDGQHYGGQIVDSEGEVLEEFADDEVNPGVAAVKDAPEKDRAATTAKSPPSKPQPQSPPAAPPPNPPPSQGQGK
jgi:hypothetical protein